MMTPAASAVAPPVTLDVERLRRDFPILSQTHGGRRLVFLDNAATSQKPRSVIETVDRYYREQNANIHRGVYRLSAASTAAYEEARVKIQTFVNAARPEEIVFVRGTTEAVNLVAQSFARPRLTAGDEILVTVMEHHSNIVPWQLIAEAAGARLRVVPMNDAGELELDAFASLLGPRTKLAALVHVSNSLGTVNPIGEMVTMAHTRGVPVLVDGAQATPHVPVDVQALGCDFYAFSGHKMFGPTGIGVLYARAELLEAMPPYQGGGEMIRTVTFARTTYAPPPARFEAGTPHIAGAIGLGAAVDYVRALPQPAVQAHERDLLDYATTRLNAVPGVRILGTARDKVSVISFVLENIHPHDVGTVLDRSEVAVRTGHHCTQPLMERLGVPATIRASFAFYNTRAEVDALVEALNDVREVFRR